MCMCGRVSTADFLVDIFIKDDRQKFAVQFLIAFFMLVFEMSQLWMKYV